MTKELSGKEIRLESADGTIFLPEGSVDLPQLTRDMKARLAVGVVAGGALACGAINCAVNTLNFLYGCAVENGVWYVAGLPPSSVSECVQEVSHWLPGLLTHIK